MAVAAILKNIKIAISKSSDFYEIWPDDTLYVHYMYVQQLSDFVRYRCIFCMVSHRGCEWLGVGFGVLHMQLS